MIWCPWNYASFENTSEQSQQQPIVILKVIEKKTRPEYNNILRSDYFPNFVARNEGQYPVIELELTLFDSEKKVLEIRRESVLGVKEEFIVYIIPGALDLGHIVSK